MPDEDFRLADHARSQAHDSRWKTAGMTKKEAVVYSPVHWPNLSVHQRRSQSQDERC